MEPTYLTVKASASTDCKCLIAPINVGNAEAMAIAAVGLFLPIARSAQSTAKPTLPWLLDHPVSARESRVGSFEAEAAIAVLCGNEHNAALLALAGDRARVACDGRERAAR